MIDFVSFPFPQVMKDVSDVLTPLAEATEMLTTESAPSAGGMYYLLHQLISFYLAVKTRPETGEADAESEESTEEYTVGATATDDDVEADEADEAEEEEVYDTHLSAKLKNWISVKLQERFSVDESGQPDMDVCRTCPLLISTFCDPR